MAAMFKKKPQEAVNVEDPIDPKGGDQPPIQPEVTPEPAPAAYTDQSREPGYRPEG